MIFLNDATSTVGQALASIGIVGLLLVILASLFWLWMLVDALTNAALNTGEKIVWAVVIFFLHLLGALLYFFVGRARRAKP